MKTLANALVLALTALTFSACGTTEIADGDGIDFNADFQPGGNEGGDQGGDGGLTDETDDIVGLEFNPKYPVCGDGVLDDGEDCDDGQANGNSSACTSKCTINECGDGYVFEGVEACDAGDMNGLVYEGQLCTEACEIVTPD